MLVEVDVEGPSFVKRSLALWLVGTLAGATVLPHAYALQAVALREETLDGIPLWLFVLSSFVQTSMFVGLGAAVGIMAADSAGLKTPVLDGWLGGPKVALSSWLPLAVVAGLVAGLATAGFDVATTPEALRLQGPAAATAWLAIPHGAVVHEILLRLLVMSVVTLALRQLGTAAVLVGIATSVLMFGGYGLLAVARMVPLTWPLAGQTLVLHGIVGATCGWVYWRRGIVPAMVAHAAADVVTRAL